MKIVLDTAPVDADKNVIQTALIDYNTKSSGYERSYLPLALLIKDDAGQTVGGLWGGAYLRWLFIEMLFVPEALRGQDLGTQLMVQAEDFARQQNLTGIWLDTFSFQARPFYERLGYTVVGTIENFPPGGARYFLSKAL